MMAGRRTGFIAAALVCGLALAVVPLLSRTIRTVHITGNSAFTRAELLERILSRPGALYSPSAVQTDVQGIVDLYHRAGYLGASAGVGVEESAADTSVIDLTIELAEGRRTLVGLVLLSGLNSVSSPEALDLFETAPGRPLDTKILEEDLSRLIERLERSGRPLAQCRVDSVSLIPGEEVDSLTVAISVDEGRSVRIDEFRIEGNRETRSDVILREVRLKKGEQYDPLRVGSVKERLSRLNVFASVSEPELYFRGDTAGLLIRVQEGPTNTFDGILGYIPGGVAGEKGYFTGLVAVGMRNLFGTGRKFSLRWQREDRSTQDLGVRYTEPWIFGAPVNLSGGFFQRQQDTAYVRRLLDGKAEVLVSDRLSLGLLLSSETIIPGADSSVGRSYASSAQSVGADVAYDSRDDIYAPLNGVRYAADYAYGRKNIQNSPEFTNGWIERLGLDIEAYLNPFRRQVIALALHGRQVLGTRIQEGEMYRMGGTRSLRGYREGQFVGTMVAWINAEYRLLTGRRSFFFGLFDLGYYSRPADDMLGLPATEGLKFGYGVGLRVDTALGIIGVSVALGKGDALSDAKIHVGIVNEF
jgi:outer membrane protein assembly factor BamA